MPVGEEVGEEVCPFRVVAFTDWSVPGQKIIIHCSCSQCCPPGFTAFLGLELKYNRVLDVTSRR